MNIDRELHEHESYLRHRDGSVNLAGGDPTREYVLAPTRPKEIYVIPSLTITIAGRGLLQNYHQFGERPGALRLEQWVTDSLGVRWDSLSMHTEQLATSEDWIQGQFSGTEAQTQLTEPGEPFEEGVLAADYRTRSDHWWDVVEFRPVGLPAAVRSTPISWVSKPVLVRGAKLMQVAWEIDDAVNKNLHDLQKYRIDLQFLNPSGQAIGTFCLTHWDGSGGEPTSPVQLPPPAPLGSLGTPIAGAFRTQSRSTAGIDFDADQVQVIIYLDITNPAVATPANVEDLLRSPSIVTRVGLYMKFYEHPTYGQPYSPAMGRRERGVFRSFRELLEFAGDLSLSSASNAHNGDDIAFLELPISTRLRADTNDMLHARFDGGANSGLSLLEIRAADALVTYERE